MENATVILTTTVNVQNKIYLFQTDKNERIQVYLKKVRQWLENTSFTILLVENTGYTFPELAEEAMKYKNRFEILSYVEAELEEAKFLTNNPYKGASEIFSIQYAYHHTRLPITDFIIKITGRFYIPDLQGYLKTTPEMYDVLVQNKKNRCEMVGCHKKHFEDVFNLTLLDANGNYSGHVEDIYQLRCSRYPGVLHCPEFYIEPTQRGGINEVFYNI